MMTEFTRTPDGTYSLGTGTQFVRDPSGGWHLDNISDSSITNNGTEALDVRSINSDGGLIKSDGNGNLTVDGLITPSIKTSSVVLTSGTMNITAPTLDFSNSGSVLSVTPTAGDNSTNVATTAFVNNFVDSFQGVKNGDISAVGKSLSLSLGDIGVQFTLTSTSTTSAQITYQAITGSVTPVDIRRVTVWGGSGVETYTGDGVTLTTTPLMVDDTIYTASNDSSAHFIRVNGVIYIITVWISGGGARASLIYRRII